MLKIRRQLGRLIFNMGIAIPGKTVFLIETAPWSRSGMPPTSIWNTSPLTATRRHALQIAIAFMTVYPHKPQKQQLDISSGYLAQQIYHRDDLSTYYIIYQPMSDFRLMKGMMTKQFVPFVFHMESYMERRQKRTNWLRLSLCHADSFQSLLVRDSQSGTGLGS